MTKTKKTAAGKGSKGKATKAAGARWTPEMLKQAQAFRKKGATWAEVGEHFGVTATRAWQLVNGWTWKPKPEPKAKPAAEPKVKAPKVTKVVAPKPARRSK